MRWKERLILAKVEEMSSRFFIIAGERRCGTTSLTTILNQHPDICMHAKRDKAWFVDDTVRSMMGGADIKPWEETHDIQDYMHWLQEACPHSSPVIGEKSADYLFWKSAHERIARLLPEVRLVVIIRDPIKRAWSHYWNEVAKKREKLSFEEALQKEEVRLQESDFSRYNFSYLSRGDYAESLEHLFRYIPPERVLIITLESFISKQQQVLSNICQFLSVREGFSFRQERVTSNDNWAVVPKPQFSKGLGRALAVSYGVAADAIVKLLVKDRSIRRRWRVAAKSPFFIPAKKVPMPESVYERLVSYYRPRKKRLEELLGRKISEWSF